MSSSLRKLHRGVAMFFTLLVLANLAVMTQGPVPSWLTYSPLPPLLLLMLSGLILFFQSYLARHRSARGAQS